MTVMRHKDHPRPVIVRIMLFVWRIIRAILLLALTILAYLLRYPWYWINRETHRF